MSAQNATNDKFILVKIHEEGGQDTVPGTALTPGVGYSENGNVTFPFPKDQAAVTIAVTKFAAKGAGVTVAFSLGQMARQANGTGDVRTITDGTIDIKITP